MAGHIKIDRKILKWEWYQDVKVFHLFLYFILRANWEDGRWKGIEVKRGQLITGRIKLSTDTGLSEREIRTCLEKLKTTGEVTIKATTKYSIITICKYETYQNKYDQSDQQIDQQSDQRKTNERPTNDQQTTTNKNSINNNKEIESTAPPIKNLSNSNLHRQPVIPDKNQVWEVFSGAGGTKEMAKSFFEKHEATGWFINGSPITNFKSLATKFIDNWKRNETNKNGVAVDSTKTKIKLH